MITVEERVDRLERVVLSVFALMTGQAVEVYSAGEMTVFTEQLQENLEAIAADLK